jgi:hypothetical protein
MKTTLCLLILIATAGHSQTSISFYAGVNPNLNLLSSDNSNYLNLYWHPGVTIGVSGEIFLSDDIAVSPSFEYASYQFDRYSPAKITIPEISLKSATGSASTMWRTFAELKLFTEKGGISRFYLSTGIGYVIEQIGTITATYADLNGPDFTNVIHPESRNYVVHTLGAGARWNIIGHFAIDLKAHYFTNYTDRMYTTIRLGVLYTLSD